jgi:hypothetical protein
MFVVCRRRVGEVFRQGNIIAGGMTFQRERASFCKNFLALLKKFTCSAV